jgi:hypothetical protein
MRRIALQSHIEVCSDLISRRLWCRDGELKGMTLVLREMNVRKAEAGEDGTEAVPVAEDGHSATGTQPGLG